MRIILLLFSGLFVAVIPLTADPVFSGRHPAREVSIPLFGRDKTKPAAQLRIGSVIIGAQRRGFFRVGILPQLEGRNVKIVFSGSHIDPEALHDVSSALQSLTEAESAEFFDFSICTAGSAGPRIRAASVLIDADRDWELTGVVTDDGRTAGKARLAVIGGQAGKLTLLEPNKSNRHFPKNHEY